MNDKPLPPPMDAPPAPPFRYPLPPTPTRAQVLETAAKLGEDYENYLQCFVDASRDLHQQFGNALPENWQGLAHAAAYKALGFVDPTEEMQALAPRLCCHIVNMNRALQNLTENTDSNLYSLFVFTMRRTDPAP